jgi:pyruvate,water dikinase
VLEAQRALMPPPVLGTPPPAPPADDAFGRFVGKFFGTPPEASEQEGELRGAPGSAGVVRGTARIIRSIAEADRLGPGDILVAQTTAPPWTPLFATVAAVVTDTGGALSHCAVVAREYGIPAVVGAAMASTVIRDGQTIEVDGTAGVVRIV